MVWTVQLIKEEAKKYNKRVDFQKGSESAYNSARRKKILDDVCSHMLNYRKVWTMEMIISEANKYNTIREFDKKSNRAYQAASRKGVLKEVCSHMKGHYTAWTNEIIRKEALKYKRRIDFHKKNSAAYKEAIKRGILDEVCTHMNKQRQVFTTKTLKKIASKYKHKPDFLKFDRAAYVSAYNSGVLDNICSHMSVGFKWVEKNIQEEAKKYNTRNEFLKNSTAYHAARRRGILEKVCEHMNPAVGGFNPNKKAILYYISINNGQAYKIGITRKTVEERFSRDKEISIKILKKIEYANGFDAYKEEQKILKEFSYAKYDGDKILVSGNSELFKYDVLGIDTL